MRPEHCPVETVLNAIGTKWTPMVVLLLGGGTRRFSELQRHLPGVSARILTDRLRALEDLGAVLRVVHAEVPPRVEYSLTARGVELAAILDAVAGWAVPGGAERCSAEVGARSARPALTRTARQARAGEAPPPRVTALPRPAGYPPSAPRRPAGPAA